MKINVDLLTYNDKLKKRDTDTIDMIVLHCTELPTMTLCRQFGEKIRDKNEQTGYCGHYYVDRDGKIYRYIEDNRIAYHVKGHNEKSMGIEIVNTGRYPDWFDSRNQTPAEEYTEIQIDAVIELINHLKTTYPNIINIKRHSDLDVNEIRASDNPDILIRRKIDPGPLFPWDEVLRKIISVF